MVTLFLVYMGFICVYMWDGHAFMRFVLQPDLIEVTQLYVRAIIILYEQVFAS